MDVAQQDPEVLQADAAAFEALQREYQRVLEQKQALEMRVRKSEERRRALMHILSDLNAMNRKLADQRKAMIHILADYEKDRSYLAKQTEHLDNSRTFVLIYKNQPVTYSI